MHQFWTKLLPPFILDGLKQRPNLQRIIANISWLSFDRVLRGGVGIIISVWMARYLGPEQYGLFNYATAFVGLFGVLVTLGLDQIVVRDIVNDPANINEIIGTAFSLKLAGGILALVFSLAIIIIMRPNDILMKMLVGVTSVGLVFRSFDVIDLWFQAQVQSKYTVYARNGAFIFIVLVKVLLILFHAPLMVFALAGLVEIIVGAVGLIIFYQQRVARLRNWQMSFTRAKEMLRVSLPLALTGVAITIYMKIDQVMLGSMVNDTEVGIYAAVVQVSEVWYFIPMIVTLSIYPTLINLYQESEERFYDKLKQVMGYFFWGTLALSLFVSVFSSQIINILYGEDYARAGGVLAIHIYASVITSMGVVFSQKFILDGTTKISFYGTVIGAVSNVILNVWLLPRYGAYGAAIATIISYSVPLLFQTIVFDKRIGLIFLSSIFYPFRDMIRLLKILRN